MGKSFTATLLFALAYSAHPLPAAAEACIIPILQNYASDPDIHLVFRGVVQRVATVAAGQVATFSVERVWKGHPKRKVIVHNFVAGRENEVVRTILRGRRYVVITFDAEQRRRSNSPGVTGAYEWTTGCGFWDADGEYAKMIVGGRQGYAPR